MSYDQLSDFIQELQDRQELRRVSSELSPELELTELTRRMQQLPGGGPALLFERVRGSAIPVVTNLLGSHRRMCAALRSDSFDLLADRMTGLIQPRAPEGWFEQLKLIPQFGQVAKQPPKTVRSGPCQQVVRLGRDIDLSEFPIPRFWPNDQRRCLTAGMICLRHPATNDRIVELIPTLVRDRNTLLIPWNWSHQGQSVLEEHRRLGTQMPVAIALGGDPVLMFAASAPPPPQSDAWIFAGFLRGQPVDLLKCRSHDLEVPAQSEIVLEGFVDPAEATDPTGPISGTNGYYSDTSQACVLHLSALTSRANPVLPMIVPGPMPQEMFWLQKAAERLFLPVLRMFVPELVDYSFPASGQFRNWCFVSIRKTFPGHARKVIHALWGQQQLMRVKGLVIVDADVDVQDELQVWSRLGTHLNAANDLILSEGSLDESDLASPRKGFGTRLALDATFKLPAEGHPQPWPDRLTMSSDVQERMLSICRELGLDRG